MSTGKILLGILAGVAAGAVVGILFAPDKGCETRKKIAKSGKDLADNLNETLKGFMADMTEKFDAAIKEAKTSAEKESQQ
jgi:gas vesicle protein